MADHVYIIVEDGGCVAGRRCEGKTYVDKFLHAFPDAELAKLFLKKAYETYPGGYLEDDRVMWFYDDCTCDNPDIKPCTVDEFNKDEEWRGWKCYRMIETPILNK